MSNLEDYRVLAGDVFFRFWSSVVRSSNSNVNLGVWSPTIRRMPGSNSWKRLSPASLPIVELLWDTYRTVNDVRCLHRSGTRFGRESSFFCKVSWTGELFV